MLANDSKSFGVAIRKRRKERGYTQAFLSEFSGLSVSFISDLERGKETIELQKAIRLANLLGLDLQLFPRENRRLYRKQGRRTSGESLRAKHQKYSALPRSRYSYRSRGRFI